MPKGKPNKEEFEIESSEVPAKEELPVKQEEKKEEVAVVDVESMPQRVDMSVEGRMPYTHVFPKIYAGVCEFHGTPYGNVDLNVMKGRCWHSCGNDPLCPHSKTGCEFRPGEDYCRHEHNYKGLQIRCSYCPLDQDMRFVIKARTLLVFQHPDDSRRIIMVCSDYRCQKKHQDRFRINVS